jgi:hypothetical protein
LQCGGKAPSLVFADCEQSGAGRELGLAGLGEYVAHKRIAFDASPRLPPQDLVAAPRLTRHRSVL